jgi:hypothetical protein
MKFIKLLLLCCIGVFFLGSTASAQANAYINIVTQNSGQVSLGGTVNIQVEVGNSGTANITASKVKTAITVPTTLVSVLPNAQQTLPSGWTILSNTAAGVITLCNGTDVIAPGDLRTILIKVQGNTLGGPSTIIGQLSFSGGTNCGSPGSLTGNNPADDNSSTSIQVIAASCALTAAGTATPILCNGSSSTLTATTTGQTGSVEYSITGGAPFQAGNTFTVPAGTYTITAREVATPGCTATSAPIAISQPVVLAASSTNTAILCNGSSSTVTVSATGGTAPYSGTGTFVVNAGPYSYTVTDANGCTSVTTGNISQPTVLTASATNTAILCNGSSSTVTVSAAGGTAPYTGTGTFSATAGTYSYTVTDAKGCTATATGTITQPAALTASATNTAILCNGGTSTVTVSAAGGTAPYTGTGTFTAPAGPYSYTVTDANGCTATATGTIAQPAIITVSATYPPITVFGGTTTVTVSATGGTVPYTGTGAFVRADGTFTFTVTDANGCTGSKTITIAPFSVPVTADPAVGQMNFVTIANAGQSANTLLFTQDYNLKVPFYNLNQTEVVPNGTIKVTVDLGTRLALASGFNLATAPLSNYFTWTSQVTGGHVIITGTQNALIPQDFASSLIFRVHGSLSCTSTITTNIAVVNTAALLIDEDLQNNAATLQYTLPVTVTTTQVNVTCNGAANGTITAITSPGTTVVITNSSNAVAGNTSLAPGVYTVTVSAAGDTPPGNTCTNSTTVTIVQPAVLVAAVANTTNNVCNSGTDGTISIASSGGTAPYTYTITGPAVNTTGAASGIFTGLAAGTYTITSKDANNCTATTTAIITQPTGTAPNISIGADITGSFFANSGISQTIVYNVSEIAGNPAVGDTIRITRVSGFTINFNTAVFSTIVGSTTYTLDNSNWKIDNSDPQFVSIILTNPSNPTGPGTLLCNQRVNVAVSITRNTTDVSTFTLSARLRKANGELNLANNLNSIILTAE